jgi:hypothetical protein
MNRWKTKLFGDNSLNFYGWISAGLLILATSTAFAWRAVWLADVQCPTILLLVAIWFVLLGQFGLALQNYCARVSQTIEAAGEQKRP